MVYSFYNGGEREKAILTEAYQKLKRHVHAVFKVRIPYGMTEDFVIKYLWSAVGYGLMSIPILFPAQREVKATSLRDEVAHRTESEFMSCDQ